MKANRFTLQLQKLSDWNSVINLHVFKKCLRYNDTGSIQNRVENERPTIATSQKMVQKLFNLAKESQNVCLIKGQMFKTN